MLSCMSAHRFAARRESVTVIAWLLIVFSSFGLLSLLMTWSMRDWPMLQPTLALYRVPFPATPVIALISVSVHLACAVGLLRRIGWARHVYVATALAMVGFSMWDMPSPWPLFAVPALIFPIVAAVFLYRPAANNWFAGEDAPAA